MSHQNAWMYAKTNQDFSSGSEIYRNASVFVQIGNNLTGNFRINPEWSPGQTVPPTQANSSQVFNLDGVGYRLATHVSWVCWSCLELAGVGSSWLDFDQAQIFAQLEPFGHLGQLSPSCLAIVMWLRGRSQTIEKFSCESPRLGTTVWPPSDVRFDFVTWLELAWVWSAVWPGLWVNRASHAQPVRCDVLRRGETASGDRNIREARKSLTLSFPSSKARYWELVVYSSFTS